MESGDFSYLVNKLWGLSSSFIISIIFMPVGVHGVGVRISNVITLNRLQSFIITHCCTMIIDHYLSMFQNCNWKSHFGRKLWQLIGVDKVQWWASMIALPIFSSSSGEGEGLWCGGEWCGLGGGGSYHCSGSQSGHDTPAVSSHICTLSQCLDWIDDERK